MGKIVVFLVPVILLVVGVPMAVAVLLTSVAAPAAGEQLRTTPCQGPYPVTGDWRPPFQQAYAVGDGFGMREHPIFGVQRLHAGIDLVSQPGPGPVVAAAAGQVSFSGYTTGGGNVVQIEHDDKIATRYLHMARRATLRAGDPVDVGEQVGFEGSTGSSTGNHLHFEVHVDGEPVDPAPFMRAWVPR